MLGTEQSKGLNINTKQEEHKDRRLYAAIPFRAATDRRLLPNDLRVLMLICGFLAKGSQIVWPHQQTMADALGVVHTLVYRHVQRLEALGYLVALAPRVKHKLCTLYGVVFDPERPPSKDDARMIEADTQKQECNTVASVENISNQPIKHIVVKPSALIVAWRGLCFDYQANELELKHWQELSILGATPAHLAEWHTPGRDLIGFYMSQARTSLR